MNTFLNLNSAQSKGLDKPIFENAKRLRKDGTLLAAQNHSYSTATSLLILSSEEAIKATLVFLHSEGYKVYKLQDAKKFFRDHKIRHQLSQLIETGNGLFETALKWEEPKKPIVNTSIKWLDYAINGLDKLVYVAQPIIKTGQRIENLNKFNDLKNNGLYVGYQNEIIDPKNEITNVHFKEVQDIIDRTFKFYRLLNVLHNPMLVNHISSKEINQLKQYLHEFIDKALKDFSFKELNNRMR